ncbi:hypothetical protein [Candidatus Vidania fulgoroideorum]
MIYKSIKRCYENFKFGKISIILSYDYKKSHLKRLFNYKIFKINVLNNRKKRKKIFIISKY